MTILEWGHLSNKAAFSSPKNSSCRQFNFVANIFVSHDCRNSTVFVCGNGCIIQSWKISLDCVKELTKLAVKSGWLYHNPEQSVSQTNTLNSQSSATRIIVNPPNTKCIQHTPIMLQPVSGVYSQEKVRTWREQMAECLKRKCEVLPSSVTPTVTPLPVKRKCEVLPSSVTPTVTPLPVRPWIQAGSTFRSYLPPTASCPSLSWRIYIYRWSYHQRLHLV